MKTKHHIIQSLKLAVIAFIALPLATMQTAAAADKADDKAADADSVVMCGKCKTVWVKRPMTVGGASGKGGVVIYSEQKDMKCADCESAAATFFKSGKLQHECKSCGSALVHCKAH